MQVHCVFPASKNSYLECMFSILISGAGWAQEEVLEVADSELPELQ